jgi:hypothetical protein
MSQESSDRKAAGGEATKPGDLIEIIAPSTGST